MAESRTTREGVMYFKGGLVYGAIWNYGKAEQQLYKENRFTFDESIKPEKVQKLKYGLLS